MQLPRLKNTSISALAPFSAIILTIACVLIFTYRFYIIEGLLTKIPCYEKKYQQLRDDQKRSFVNHHVAGTCKFLLVFVLAVPFGHIIFGNSTPHTPFTSGSSVTIGDALIVGCQVFTAMYIFELFYRVRLSPIAALHHMGAVVIGQTAVAISIDYEKHPDATIEFLMCIVWGAFDCIAELWPHIAMIYYRLQSSEDDVDANPRQRHIVMSRVFLLVSIMEVTGTLVETAFVFWLWGSVWARWTLGFKIVTPILHVLFCCAQLWGAWVFWNLYGKELQSANTISTLSDQSDTSRTASEDTGSHV